MEGILSADQRIQLLRESLSGLTHRQQLIANNLANVDTPGYRSFDVPFEQLLERQIKREGELPLRLTAAGHMSASVGAPGELAAVRRRETFRVDGNGVDVDAEMERLSETAIQFSAVTQLLSARIAILKSAVTEGRR